jgi:hypothetical protein
MKRIILLVVAVSIQLFTIANAQTYIDPSLKVEAKVLAYQLQSAPIIDGNGTEWENIQWQKLYFGDKDFNGDNLADPIPSRNDFDCQFKAAWIEGTSTLYLLINIKDDVFHNPDTVNWYNKDGMEIRIDPFDAEDAGEPSSTGTAFNLGFTIGKNNASGLEGPATNYSAAWNVNEQSFPKEATLEVAIELPSTVKLQKDYELGFMLYCSDNDLAQDDSPKDKDAVLAPWPQRYSAISQNRIGIDGTWENIYYWGNLGCVAATIHEVSSGSSIQSAIDAASEGDIIKVAAGTYTENIVIDKPYIQLIGTMTSTDTTKLMPADGSQPIIQIAGDDVAYGVVIKNMSFDGWSVGTDGTVAVGNTGIEIGSAQAEILGNYFTGLSFPVTKGSVDSSKAYACVLEDNHLYKCKGGLIMNTPSTIFRYNTIEENTGGYGVQSKGLLADNMIDIGFNTVFNHHGECGIGYGGSGVFTVHDNFLVRSEQLYGAGDTTGDDGIENQDEGGSTDYIYNNTIVGWKSDGMQLGASSKGTSNYHIVNNLIANCAGKDYDIRTTGSYEINYGLSYNNKGGNKITTLGTNALESDPMFTAEYEDDFTITSRSPAIDAGLTEPFGFKLMYFGEGLDIGAYEVGSPVVSVEEETTKEIPTGYVLEQNYPNPFNPTTTINFSTPKNGQVSLKVYNVLGQLVTTLVNGELSVGNHQVTFNATGLASGLYFYTINSNDFSSTKKMMLIK